jgi:long-subunit acyl-CoA synthetase (AMP-forming)
MKRAVICVPNPWNHIPDYESEYSIMVINPALPLERIKYLLDNADYSLLVNVNGVEHRNGNDYPNERLFWYTSGTTGDSKFYSFSHDKVEHAISNVVNSYNLTANDRYVSIMPLWHAHGQMFYHVAKKLGMEINYLAINRIHSIADFQPTFITAVPDILKLLVKQQFNSLRFVRTASAALSDQLYYLFKNAFNVPVIEAFGMTETCSQCFTNPLYGEQRIGTIGYPAGVEAQIVDGRLHLQGPAIFKSGWFDTQDLAEVDDDGYYKIVGRAVDTINIRGVKYNPLSLEQQIMEKIPGVGECVIFGTDRIKCLYTGDIDPVLIRNFLIGINNHCRPVLLQRVDQIPVDPLIGKLSKKWLNTNYT